jgi:hypothetical protein
MAKPYDDKKLRLGEPLASKLRDFCAANYRAAALDVIRDAVEEHINRRLENPEMRERYETERRKRLSLPQQIVQLVPKKNGD